MLFEQMLFEKMFVQMFEQMLFKRLIVDWANVG
jgi:hypothetical protein